MEGCKSYQGDPSPHHPGAPFVDCNMTNEYKINRTFFIKKDSEILKGRLVIINFTGTSGFYDHLDKG